MKSIVGIFISFLPDFTKSLSFILYQIFICFSNFIICLSACFILSMSLLSCNSDKSSFFISCSFEPRYSSISNRESRKIFIIALLSSPFLILSGRLCASSTTNIQCSKSIFIAVNELSLTFSIKT